MVRFRVRHNMRDVVRALEQARDFSPAYRSVQGLVHDEVRRALLSEGRTTGEPFKANSAAYRARKVDAGLSGRVMTRTGRTLQSVSGSVGFKIGRDRMELTWNGNEGVAIAQKATGRRFFLITPAMAVGILQALEQHIQRHLDGVRGV